MFIGYYGYPPNADAAERLATRILPRIRAAMPEARALIVGKASNFLPSFGRGLPGVEYLGYVDDLAGLYARSRVVCCPLTNGGGTRVKLIEAASYARPMVSTRIGAEGLEFRDGAEIVLADDDEAIAAACLALLRDDARCAALGAAARQRMQACYAAPAVSERLSRILRETLAD
jgi:Glycosyltransferase